MKLHHMKWVLMGLLLMPVMANAKLSQPDYVLYGTATWFGGPLATESEVSIYLNNQLITVANYAMGTDQSLNGLYALRVPMDANDPREFGKARPGDPASIYINGSLVAEVLIGEYGVAERLDIDPINLSGDASVINISGASVTETDSGQVDVELLVTLSNSSDAVVTVDWVTVDDTAVGADACNFDVDYLNSSGTATIPIGQTQALVRVPVCGDALIESTETFDVVLSNAQNGIIQFDRGVATILDNDGLPELRGFDRVVFEPENGVLTQTFELKLSRSYEQDVQVTYQTVAGSAMAGVDFVSSSGQLTIPAGSSQANIAVDFLADGIEEDIEFMTVLLSNPVNTTLVNSELKAFILDANKDEQTTSSDQVDSNAVPELISPSDVQFSADGKQVYVSSLAAGGSILRFGFKHGKMTFLEKTDAGTAGFEAGLFGLIRDITFTPDGQFLFAASSEDQAIMSMSRDAVTGSLSLTQVVENNSPTALGINGVYGLDISADGKHLYAAGSISNSIAVFEINDVDGSLTHLESEYQGVDDTGDSGPTVTFMDRPVDVVVSPNGQYVLVAADFSSSLVVFERDVVTGLLTYQQSFKNGISGISGIGGASALWVSDDNKQVYVAGRAVDSLATFAIDDNGVIAFEEAISQANGDFIGLNSPAALLGNASGDRLYVLGFEDSTMVTFERNAIQADAGFGDLAFADIEQDDVQDIDNMAGPVALDIDTSNQWILVAAGIDNAIEIFKTHLNDLIFASSFD
ncbi:beta-propeller fold lactonase family protein [Marinicella sediminis]|uniref:Beta-propeller fold lactonase family protein n=1 Tax=Marinicella sediminis TaxID=1792834 RepID=A0ABV7JBQ9_9GAMM|nr:beta-propeller fold lactonase family protein [Marinicella sediminis]